ncbi:putative GTP-binding protein YjiA [Granulicatella adiacens]|uniref:CobW family GTP-binding protein n=1 Tax=Granulicatella adiacens TaxID=46124 RepID=UPI00195F0DDD|nr:GTP-binding protein [Granulicatella adiacens]VTX52154.1 putative GTP-binding protein YjiA [Granulicatella adiacens]
MSQKIPVTIVSGFLGAGKTTLINKVLKEKHGEHIAVVINEFGEIGVDHQFVLDVEEEIYQMDNGCLCCTLRTDIADMLKSILMVKEQNGIRVDRVLFETTGLADPAPIAQTFINVPFLNEHFILDAVLTVVDAKNFLYQTAHQPEPAKQVGFADKIFMSKHSLVDETIYAKVINEVRSINAFAEIQDLDARPVQMSDMFGLELFYASEKKILEMQEHAEEEYCEECGHTHAHGDHDHEHHHHDHDHKHHDYDHEHEHEHDHHDHDHEHHHHHSHSHHSGINSFVIETEKPLVLANINEWLNELVYIYGPELYRYKGILNVEGLDYQIIFQGVQMSFDISRGRDWKDTKRGSTLVFIGKNLPENQLRESFIKCTEK